MSRWYRHDPLKRNPAGGHASALRRAIGLGAAKTGAEDWWLQRVTAVALVPLLIWFMAELIAHAGADRHAMADWLGWPPTAALMIALLIALFRHLMLGVQVIAEDYLHADRLRFMIVALIHTLGWALAGTGVFAVLSLAFR